MVSEVWRFLRCRGAGGSDSDVRLPHGFYIHSVTAQHFCSKTRVIFCDAVFYDVVRGVLRDAARMCSSLGTRRTLRRTWAQCQYCCLRIERFPIRERRAEGSLRGRQSHKNKSFTVEDGVSPSPSLLGRVRGDHTPTRENPDPERGIIEGREPSVYG